MGKVLYSNIQSKLLDKQMAFSIYLPDKYDGESRFPVLYFLHGRSGDERIMDELEIKSIADVLIDSGQIKSMIIVCPRMDNTRGLNTSEVSHQIVSNGMEIDSGRYEDYFIQEFLPYIDCHFKTIPHRGNRFVGGASAGGFAATHYGLQYPELFFRIGGHMPAIETELDPSDIPYYGDEHSFHKNNPLEFDRFEELHQMQEWFLDAGDEDEGGFNNVVESLSKVLMSQGICVEHHISPGHHDLQYVKNNIRKYLIFYGNGICMNFNK